MLLVTVETSKQCDLYSRNKKTMRFIQQKQENYEIFTVETKKTMRFFQQKQGNYVIGTCETRKLCDLSSRNKKKLCNLYSRNKKTVRFILKKQENGEIFTVELRKL